MVSTGAAETEHSATNKRFRMRTKFFTRKRYHMRFEQDSAKHLLGTICLRKCVPREAETRQSIGVTPTVSRFVTT